MLDVLIIGAGLSGIGAARHLQQHNPRWTWRIWEARDRIGGTWDLFRYPGVRSDSDMHTLGYVFKPWRGTQAMADGPSILNYIREAADETQVSLQIDFEHRIAQGLLKHEAQGHGRVVVEDEGQFIGRCSIPGSLYNRMQQAPILWLEDTIENRESRILNDYVIAQRADHDAAYGAEGAERFATHLLDSLSRIKKRLGGERYERARGAMIEALALQATTGNSEAHRGWIGLLLREYYDPMYVHQKSQKSARITATGYADTLYEFLTKNRART